MFSTKFRWFICNPFKMQFSPLHSLEHHCNYLNVILRYFTTRYYFSDRWDQYWGEQPPRQIVSDFPLLCLSSSSRVSLIYFLSLSLSSVKPSLKKVTKQENKFANLQKKAAAYNFRQNLKVVTKSEFTIKDEDKTGVSLILKNETFWDFFQTQCSKL